MLVEEVLFINLCNGLFLIVVVGPNGSHLTYVR